MQLKQNSYYLICGSDSFITDLILHGTIKKTDTNLVVDFHILAQKRYREEVWLKEFIKCALKVKNLRKVLKE